jgi:hypothetical protein
MKRRTAVFLGAAAIAIALAIVVGMAPFVAQDRCLDAGGAWQGGRCVH